ncbi:MAG TPA: SGNH/GDSL hydrolase family protein [Actinocrinis sp.]|nr:SGNH/GDSL hydrolase family protein [Actinocrinis sp.]
MAALAVALTLTLFLAACSGSPGATPAAAARTNAPAHPDPKATPTHSLNPYVALGDSYTSGPGIPDQVGQPSGCDRSSRDYPALVAADLRLAASQVRDVSCSGATIADLSTAQPTKAGTNPAQITALSDATGLVTLGIGGNDVDFAGVLAHCVERDVIPALINTSSGLAPCRSSYTSGGVDQIQQKIQTAADNLATALAQIKQRAPHARIYVIGYPALVPPSGTACAHTLGITQGDVAFLHDEELRLNSMLKQHAESTGATYVDTYAPSAGHDACSSSAARWIEPLVPASSAVPLHPNARGEQGMADAVLRAIKSS